MKWCRVLHAIMTMLAVILFSPGVQNVSADQIMLKNGDKISGTLMNVDKGILTLTTIYAEKLEINSDSVQSIATDQPVKVRLQNGDIVSGPLKTEAGDICVLAGPERGAMCINWSQIVSINVTPPPASTWEGNLFLGAFEQSGNTDRTSVTFGGDSTRKSERDRFGLSLLYNYAKEEDSLTTRDLYGAIKYDYFFTEKFYGLLSVEMLKDKFKDLNLRTIVGPGIGYQLWDEQTSSLAVEVGLAYVSEDRIASEDDQWLTARLGARCHYKLSEQVTFSDNLALYPNLESSGEFTSRNEAALITTFSGPWALRLANVWEHDSDPAAGIKKDDSKSSLSLQYSF